MISGGDRSDISAMHGYPRKVPAQHRDASNAAAGPSTPRDSTTWKKPATPIMTPSNPPRLGVPSTPYNLTAMSSSGGRRPSGNPTASQTFLECAPLRPAKKQKTRHDAPPSIILGKGTPGISTFRKPQIPPEVIDVDENDEVWGVSDDPLNIVDTTDEDHPFVPPSRMSASKKPTRSWPPVLKKPIEYRIFHDGEATKSLEKNLAHQLADSREESPIEEFTPPAPDPTEPPPFKLAHLRPSEQTARWKAPTREGAVWDRVAMFDKKDCEGRGQSSGPWIDFRLRPPGNVKANMKPKNPFLPKHQDGLSAPSFPSQKSSSGINPPVAKCLPLKYWFLGLERKAGDWFVHWESREKEMIWFAQGGRRASTYLTFDVQSDFGSTEYTRLSDSADDENLVLNIHTLKVPRGLRRKTERFQLGDKHCGKILLVFNRDDSVWHDSAYDAFIAFIKRHVRDIATIRPSAARSILETAEKGAKAASDYPVCEDRQASRSSKHSTPGEGTLGVEPTPPPVETNVPPPRGASVSTSRPKPRTVPNTISSEPTTSTARRSSRQRALAEKHFPPVDLEEVILCFPQGIPGAVNITVGDMKRLEPGEFLNDTLIEFGLKLWLQRLEEQNPELVKQIHVFSSFFYKKLNKKNIDEGYDSVRKWTSKIDIFSKKYIIVPINENLHWYLVIIYHPEHVLHPPPPLDSPSTRTRRNISTVDPSIRPPTIDAKSSTNSNLESNIPRTTFTEQSPSSTVPSTTSSSRASSNPSDEDDKHEGPSSEIDEVDQFLTSNVGSFNIDAGVTPYNVNVARTYRSPTPPVTEYSAPGDPSASMEVDEGPPDKPQSHREVSPTVSEIETLYSTAHPPSTTEDVDMQQAEGEVLSGTREPSRDVDMLFGDGNGAVEPNRFYAKAPPRKSYGSQKVASRVSDEVPEVSNQDEQQEEIEEEEDIISGSAMEKTTYIFTLDSLGSRHPQAIKQLTNYLEKEAKDKKGVAMTSKAIGRQAIVPVQPNFCDCGLYLLHLAETFMAAPDTYCNLILSRKGGKSSQAERQQQWHATKVQDLRDKLTTDIIQLSKKWKVTKEEAKKREGKEGKEVVEVVESSDDEVDIVEHTPAVVQEKATRGAKSAKGKGPAAAKGTPLRPRG